MFLEDSLVFLDRGAFVCLHIALYK